MVQRCRLPSGTVDGKGDMRMRAIAQLALAVETGGRWLAIAARGPSVTRVREIGGLSRLSTRMLCSRCAPASLCSAERAIHIGRRATRGTTNDDAARTGALMAASFRMTRSMSITAKVPCGAAETPV